MDLANLLLDFSQARAIDTLDERTIGSMQQIAALRRENAALRIRVAALIRLLVERGVFDPDDYSRVVGELEAQVGAGKPRPKPAARTARAKGAAPARSRPAGA
jgi:hypothetical protein